MAVRSQHSFKAHAWLGGAGLTCGSIRSVERSAATRSMPGRLDWTQ